MFNTVLVEATDNILPKKKYIEEHNEHHELKKSDLNWS